MNNLDLLLPAETPETDTWTWATVEQVSPLRIRIDGEPDALDMTPECLYAGIEVGQRVWAQRIGRRVIVHAPSGGVASGGSGTVDISDVVGLQAALDGKSATTHTHDDRYYTETETNTLLAGKSDTTHTHDTRYYQQSVADGRFASLTADQTLSGKQTFSKALVLAEQGSTPADPASGTGLIYFKSDGLPYVKGDDAIERPLIALSPAIHENPDFEAWQNYDDRAAGAASTVFPTRWSAFWSNQNVVFSFEGTDKVSGQYALKAVRPVNQITRVHSLTIFPVSAGSTLTFSFWAKADRSGTTSTVTLLSTSDGSIPEFFGSGTSQTAVNVNLSTVWQKYEVSISAPTGATKGRFSVSFQDPSETATTTFWFDNTGSATKGAQTDAIRLKQMTTPNTPASGEQLLYPKSDGKWYTKDASGIETAIAGSANLPVGSIVPWAAATAPTGFLIADGAAVSRATYSALFAVIGTTYGAGDGSTTFNLPNMVGRVPVGLYSGGSYANGLGVYGGEATHVLTASEMPVHSHAQNVLANGAAGSGWRVDYAGDRFAPGAFPQGVNTGDAGGGAAHNNLQPYTTVNYIIRALPSASVDTATFQYFKGAVLPNSSVSFAATTNMALPSRVDPANGWNTGGSYWVVPQPGRYRVTVAFKANTTVGSTSARIMKNGSVVASSGISPNAANTGVMFSDVLELVAGDTIAVQPSAAFTSQNDGAGVENTYLIIESVGLNAAPTYSADSGWINVTFNAGWSQYPGWDTCAYRKKDGIVYLRGLAIGPNTTGSVMFTLPVGFRPAGNQHVVTAGNATYAAWNIMADGRVMFNSGGPPTSWISLQVAPFPADN